MTLTRVRPTVERVRDVGNTAEPEAGEGKLDAAGGLQYWLVCHGLAHLRDRATERDAADARVLREALRELYSDEELPRNVYYGDGSIIPDAVVEHLGEVFEKVAVRGRWQKGDMIMLDNMLTTHARDPFEGERKIVVAMGQMITIEEALSAA